MERVETPRVRHECAEAFCLMVYRCKACSHEETVWNTRDGVTPFIIACEKCGGEATHINWQNDVRDPEYTPAHGQRVFIDLPESLKAPFARRRLDVAKGTKYEVTDPEERRQLVRELVASYQPGEPWLVRV